jgi:transposase
VNPEIEDLAASDEAARADLRQRQRATLSPPAGLLSSSADEFKKARDIAAWIGLVLQQYSMGGRTQMLGISKCGNRYVRRLLIHGARSCVVHIDRTRDRLGAWIAKLQSRMHINKVTVALAAKIARIAWVVINRPGTVYERSNPAVC